MSVSKRILFLIVIVGMLFTACEDKKSKEPNTQKIIYCSQEFDYIAEIFSMEIDGSNKTNLTNSSYSEYAPKYSPDWSKIAYAGGESYKLLNLYVMDADGSNQTKLTSYINDYGFRDFEFSPDGSKIIYTYYSDGNSDIYTIDVDGKNHNNLTNTPATYEEYPQYSPDGQQIVFLKNEGNVFIMDIDGNNVTQLTDSDGNGPPCFSPDGQNILYADGSCMYIMDIDGSNNTILADGGLTNGERYVDYWNFSISPDESKIMVKTRFYGNIDIYLMDIDGSNLTNLTNTPYPEDHPPQSSQFSPDGSQIVFSTSHIYYYGDIYLINIDGSNLTNLTNTPYPEYAPQFGPMP